MITVRLHKAQLVHEYLQSEDIQPLEWTTMSPGLNPIEYEWEGLRHSITAQRPAPAIINELKSALVRDWVLLPQRLMRTLANSMKDRCKSCVAVAGDFTPN
ncbi:transposable element Tc1 transposase [Trichonephila clavipes]|nr:transposable element Tc1 transposase [Trichonephila clavipes]